jgi:hypothetical protein
MLEEVNEVQPQGKGFGIAGFVMSLVGFILAVVFAGLAAISVAFKIEKGEEGGYGLMYFWIVFCLISVALSAIGMMKLGKTGGKKGLAIAGLVIGLVALLWSFMLFAGIEQAATNLIKNGGLEEFRNL